MKYHNPARVTASVWIAITILAVLGIFAPSIIGMDGMNGGFAISFVCLMLVITGVVVVIVYLKRASQLDRILGGENVLARWPCSREEWSQYAEEEHRRDSSEKRILFFMIAGIALVVGIGFLVADPDSGRWVLATMLGLIAFMGVVAWTSIALGYRRNKNYTGAAIIATNGLYQNRQLHLWNELGASLESVTYVEEQHPYLSFAYLAPTRSGMQEYSARVPVPRGKEVDAKDLVARFNSGTI